MDKNIKERCKLTEIKKHILLYAFILSCSVLILYPKHNSNAMEEIIDINQPFHEKTLFLANGGYWAQILTPKNNDIGQITLDLCANDSSKNLSFKICEAKYLNFSPMTCNFGNLLYNHTFTAGTELIKICDGTSDETDFHTFNLLGFTFNANTTYAISLNSSGAGGTFKFGYSEYDIYEDGYFLYDPGSTSSSTANDMYFQMYYTPADSVQFNTPTQDMVLKDFPNWQIYYNTTNSTSTYQIQINYGTNPTHMVFMDIETVPSFKNVSWSMEKTWPLSTSTYYAVASLYKDSYSVATSSLLTFYINNVTGTDNYLGGTISTVKFKDICARIDTTTFFGAINCGFRKVLDWAFSPSDYPVDDINTAINSAKTKIPWSIWFDIPSTINSALASTSSSTDLTIDIPMGNMTATGTSYYGVPIITSSTIDNAIGSSTNINIRQKISYIIYLIFALIIITIGYILFF